MEEGRSRVAGGSGGGRQTEGLWGQTSQSVSVWLAVGPDVLSLTRLPFLSSETQISSCHYPALPSDKRRIQTDLRVRLIVRDGSSSHL